MLGCGALAVALGTILTGFATDLPALAAVVAVIAAKIAMLPLLVWVLLQGVE